MKLPCLSVFCAGSFVGDRYSRGGSIMPEMPRWLWASQKSGRIGALSLSVLCLTVSCGAQTARAFTAADADAIFDAHTKAFYRVTNGVAWHAANLLGYTNEARLAALYTMNQMCQDGYLPPSGESGDGGGFNGIGVRWMARFMKDRGEQATFESWLQKNAQAAWQARRGSDNLSWCRWPQPTTEDKRYSWGCSSAVVILQVVRPTETLKPAHLK